MTHYRQIPTDVRTGHEKADTDSWMPPNPRTWYDIWNICSLHQGYTAPQRGMITNPTAAIASYIPRDRVAAIVRPDAPIPIDGVALLADISGFTALTEAL